MAIDDHDTPSCPSLTAPHTVHPLWVDTQDQHLESAAADTQETRHPGLPNSELIPIKSHLLPALSSTSLQPGPIEPLPPAIQRHPRRRSDSDNSTAHNPRNRHSIVSTDSEGPLGIDTVAVEDSTAGGGKPYRRHRTSHCAVERKYRDNLNAKFAILRQNIPGMQARDQGQAPGADSVDPYAKATKADILTQATGYVRQMEEEKKTMESEILLLRSRVAALERMVECGHARY